eukprot:s633_g2.t1
MGPLTAKTPTSTQNCGGCLARGSRVSGSRTKPLIELIRGREGMAPANVEAGEAVNEDPDTEKPLLRRPDWTIKAFWSVAVIVVSAALINYNKYLMNPSRFPYPMVLVSLHMFCGSVLSSGLYLAMPSLFPALTDPDKKVAVNATFLLQRVLPVGVAFATSLICSNVAYEYASVPFLQMVKQSNVIIVFLLSLLIGLEKFRSNMAIILLCIVIATGFTVNGELRFSLPGLVAQLAGNFAESCRVVMQGVLLTGADKLDPLSFVAVVSPICGFCLAGLMVSFNHWHPVDFAAIPSLQTLRQCSFLLAGNVAVAFSLNLITANYLKHGSPLALLLTNLIKDAIIVIAGCAVFGDPISLEQGFGFVAQLFFIFLWSIMKVYPETFHQEGLWQGFSSVLHGKARRK